MPIRRELRHHYRGDWRDTARACKDRAGWRCEQCDRKHGELDERNGKPVVLTCAHVNRVPGDDRPENLRALCAPCHLRYDAPAHRAARNSNLRRQMNTPDLFGGAR